MLIFNTDKEYTPKEIEDTMFYHDVNEDEAVFILNKKFYEKFQKIMQGIFNGEYFYLMTGRMKRWDGVHDVGFLIKNYNDFMKLFSDMDEYKVDYKNGNFVIYGIHHDGWMEYNIKRVTRRGIDFINTNNACMYTKDLYNTVFNQKEFSLNISKNRVKSVY